MYTFVSFTVAELFEKVWETPMVKLAHDIGVSDVAVAKACRKPASPSQVAATGQNLKSSGHTNPSLLRSKVRSDSRFSTVTLCPPRLALIRTHR